MAGCNGNPASLADEAFAFGPLRVFPNARRLERHGITVSLGSRAFDLLCLLITRAGDVVSKSDLMAKAWPGLTVDEGSLRYQITRLRNALATSDDGESYIRNISGRGYCFVAAIESGVSQLETVVPRRTPNSSLPARHDRIFGRDSVVVALKDHLAKRRLVTLRGPGGIGKTTVAVAVAHEIGARFRDGVRFLDLGRLTDPNLLVSTIISALGMVGPARDSMHSLIAMVQDRQLLLVLDSCEHIVEAVAYLAGEIYEQAPGVSILTTSREALNIRIKPPRNPPRERQRPR